MYNRRLKGVIDRLRKGFPIVGITGPRQSGKTMLARHLPDALPYVSLEDLDVRAEAQEDPRGFLKRYKGGAIFDEVQNVPELLSYLQGVVDDTNTPGRFIITGSQNFALSDHIAQSLAGRVGMTTLLPLSLSEIGNYDSLDKIIFQGGYPRLYQNEIAPNDFYSSYIATYIERDLRQLKNIDNLSKFQLFLKLCAGRVGQIINYTSLAQDAGISNTTAKEWLSLLEASYIIFFVQPFYKNFKKRLIKSPKLYFYDTGVACHLLGIESEKQIDHHFLKGALYENLAILELLKARFNKGTLGNLYYWRDSAGHEVDCVTDFGGVTKAIEIKASHTFHSDFLKNLKYFSEVSTDPVERYLVFNTDKPGIYQDTEQINFSQIEERLA